jgi:hypothetical protein
MKENTAAEIREYRRHAKRCRELAAAVDGFEKEQLKNLAEEWERRASEAEARLPDGPVRATIPDQRK